MSRERYFSHVRKDVVGLLDGTYGRVLEVGCGTGATLAYLKKQGMAEEVYGIEFDARVAKQAEQVLDGVWVGDAETIELPDDMRFDVVLLPDVLEHLREPGDFLKKIGRHLEKDGCMVISVPNVQHVSVVRQLWRGEWRYEDEGIMDRTHLRFFTRKSVVRMIEEAGFSVEEVRWNGGELGFALNVINWISGDRLRVWWVSQWLLRVRRR